MRVPELNYLHRLSAEPISEKHSLEDQVLSFLLLPAKNTQSTLLKQIYLDSQHHPLSVEINNIAFFIDRVFDVFLRKNDFPTDISFIIDKWRFPFFKVMYFTFKQALNEKNLTAIEQSLRPFNGLVDRVTTRTQGWSETPKRSKYILIDELNSITRDLFSNDMHITKTIFALNERWQTFSLKQQDKFIKVTDRLITLEKRKSWLNCCQWFAVNFVNTFYSKHMMPLSLQGFIKEYWVNILAQHVELAEFEGARLLQLEKSYELLSKNLFIAFCRKDDKAFKLADHILDDLQERVTGLTISIPEDIWMSLELSLLAQLKGEEEKKYLYKPMLIEQNLKYIFNDVDPKMNVDAKVSADAETSPQTGSWYVEKNQEQKWVSYKLIAKFDQSKVMLFSNYLGMKMAEYSFSVFAKKLKNRIVKPIKPVISFSEVFKSTVKGLLKVADVQQKSRIAAAEKAKAEAEELLKAKKHADELVAKKAEEIALRTRLLQQKRDDKIRSDKASEILAQLSGFNLGAWISIKNEESKQRYKLVVKLAATGKYIFVDKLGVKKREFYQADLVECIVNEEVEILSDGAEFEDCLERVVSRLRMSK